MKYAIAQWCYPGKGIYSIRLAAQAGFDGIQIELGDYTNGYYMQYREIQGMYLEEAEKYGVEFPSIALNDIMRHGFLGPKDDDDYKLAMDSVDMILDVAVSMNLDSVTVPSFFESQINSVEDFDRTVEVLKYICSNALKSGISVGSETSLSAERQIELIRQVDMPNLKTFFDTQNLFWFDGLAQTENLTKLMPFLGNQMHVCDGLGRYKDGGPSGGYILGKGDAEFFEQMKILGENHYDGWLISENLYWKKPLCDTGNPVELAKIDLEVMRTAVAENFKFKN